MYLPLLILLSFGFSVSAGMAHVFPNYDAPSIRPSLQRVLIRLRPMPHFSDASLIVIYPSIFASPWERKKALQISSIHNALVSKNSRCCFQTGPELRFPNSCSFATYSPKGLYSTVGTKSIRTRSFVSLLQPSSMSNSYTIQVVQKVRQHRLVETTVSLVKEKSYQWKPDRTQKTTWIVPAWPGQRTSDPWLWYG